MDEHMKGQRMLTMDLKDLQALSRQNLSPEDAAEVRTALKQEQDALQGEVHLIHRQATSENNRPLSAHEKMLKNGFEGRMQEISNYLTGALGGGRKTAAGSSSPLDPNDARSASMFTPGSGQRRSGGGTPGPRRAAPATDRTYAAMFPDAQMGDGGFSSADEFFEVLHAGVPDHRLMMASTVYAGHNERVGSDGGFLVPDQYAATILDRSLHTEIVRPRATVYPMAGPTLKVPGWSDADDPNSGYTAQWVPEGGTFTESKGKFRQMMLTAAKMGLFTKSSNELIADGMSFDALVTSKLANLSGRAMDKQFLNGTGAGLPQGILTARNPALIVVPKVSGQVAGTLIYENFAAMYARLHPSCLANSVWVINQSAIPSLLQLGVVIGLGGQLYPALQESNGQFKLLGRPCIFTDLVPALGAQGDVSLIDFSSYVIGQRQQVEIAKSQHIGFQTDECAYRAILRVDGQSSWDKAITPANGSTLSWAVTLAVRA